MSSRTDAGLLVDLRPRPWRHVVADHASSCRRYRRCRPCRWSSPGHGRERSASQAVRAGELFAAHDRRGRAAGRRAAHQAGERVRRSAATAITCSTVDRVAEHRIAGCAPRAARAFTEIFANTSAVDAVARHVGRVQRRRRAARPSGAFASPPGIDAATFSPRAVGLGRSPQASRERRAASARSPERAHSRPTPTRYRLAGEPQRASIPSSSCC